MVFAGLKPDVMFDLDPFVDEATYRALLATGRSCLVNQGGEKRPPR
jgi:hypothetical protein